MSPLLSLALSQDSPLQPTMWVYSLAISGKNLVDLGESAAGSVIVDLAWEWLMGCPFPDYESGGELSFPLGGVGSNIRSVGRAVGWGCGGSLPWTAMLRYCYRRKGKQKNWAVKGRKA